jgi:hypothetical protein
MAKNFRVKGIYFLHVPLAGRWLMEWVPQSRSWHLRYMPADLQEYVQVDKFPTAEGARAFVASGHTGFRSWDTLHPQKRDVVLSGWTQEDKEIDFEKDPPPE